MEYTGKLYGKIGRRLIPLTMTSEEVDRLVEENAKMKEALQRIAEYQGRFGEDDPNSVATECLHERTYELEGDVFCWRCRAVMPEPEEELCKQPNKGINQ